MKKALEDVTIIDLTRFASGPFCTCMMADLGANVIKIERPQAPDDIRTFPPYINNDQGDYAMTGYFAQYNRNKKAITLDYRSEGGRKVLFDLIRKADVLCENFSAGALEHWDLGWDVLKKVNPKLVLVRITGFGQNGPYARYPAFDNSAQAASGLWSLNGFPDRPPVRVGITIGDLGASMYAGVGLLAALHHARNTGEGQVVDISMTDCLMTICETAMVQYSIRGNVPTRLGNDGANSRPYSMFQTKDGYVFFGAFMDKFWNYACDFFGEPEYKTKPGFATRAEREAWDDPNHYETVVKPVVARWLSQYTTAELEKNLAPHVPLMGIKSIEDVYHDPQVRARDMIIKHEYPCGSVEMPGTPFKMSVTPGDPNGLAPYLGANNAEVYREFLGYSQAEINALSEEHVI